MSWLSSAIKGIGKAVSGIGHFIGDKVLPILGPVVSLIPGVGQIAGPIINVLQNAIKTGGGIKAITKGLPGTLLSAIPGGVGGIGKFLQSIPGVGGALSSVLSSGLGKAVSGAVGFIGNKLQPIGAALKGAYQAVAGTPAAKALGNVVNTASAAVKKELGPGFTEVKNGIVDQAKQWLGDVSGQGGGGLSQTGGFQGPFGNGLMNNVLGGLSAYQAAEAGQRGENYAKGAYVTAMDEYNKKAPIRALGMNTMLNAKPVDFSSMFADAGNPYHKDAPPVPGMIPPGQTVAPTVPALQPQAPPTPSLNVQALGGLGAAPAAPAPAMPAIAQVPPLPQPAALPPAALPVRPLSLTQAA